METIKLAAQTRGIKGIASEARAVIAARGVSGLWAGNALNCTSARQMQVHGCSKIHTDDLHPMLYGTDAVSCF